MSDPSLALTVGAFVLLAFVIVKGERAAQVLALYIFIRLAAGLMASSVFGAPQYLELNTRNFVFDLIQTLIIVLILRREERFWILACLAIQLFTLVGHLAPILGIPGMRRAYWVMLNVPIMLQVLILLSVSFNVERHRKSRTKTSGDGP